MKKLLWLFAFVVLIELILQTCPSNFRIKKKRIILSTNRTYVFRNYEVEGLSNKIIHTINSLGFRGKGNTKVIAVGGSTTNCFYQSDEDTWCAILGIENAGFNGHSTFAHIILMEDYIVDLKPEIVLFLIGVNDMTGKNKPTKGDRCSFRHMHPSWQNFLVQNSEIVFRLGRLFQSSHPRILSNIKYTQLKKSIFHHIIAYKQRVRRLVNISKENNIWPVLITQPGIEEEKIKFYNNAVREVAEETNTQLIDLAKEMPHNELWFYDYCHFTDAGAEKVAEIIAREIR